MINVNKSALAGSTALVLAKPALAASTGLVAPRAVRSNPRADGTDPKVLFEQLNEAVKAMRDKIDAQGKKVDAIDAAQIDKINTTVGELQAALTAANETIAALKLGGSIADGLSSAEREHIAAFNDFQRSGKIEARGQTFSEPDGGFLAPKQVDTAITRTLGKTVAMRRLSGAMAISRDTYVKHKSLGGASSGWVGEGDDRPETDTPKLARMEFVTGELYAEPVATQILLDDSEADVEAWFAGEVAIEFAEQEGAAFITGDGKKKPRGLLSYGMVANANWAWGKLGYIKSGSAADITDANGQVNGLIDLVHGLKSGYRQGASFLMNDLTLAAVRKIKNADGDYLWQPSLTADAPELLLGKPVDTDDNMPDIAANATPIAFGDFKQGYLIVDRLGVRVLRNPYKQNGLVFFYTTKRVGGGVQNFEAIKLFKLSA